MSSDGDGERNIRARLTRLYGRLPVENATESADFALRAVETFFGDVARWSDDMPRPHPRQLGKGRPQIQPSQQRIHVIAELEQFATFMDAAAARKAGKKVSITPLKGRRRISRYAIRAILGTGLIGSARLSPWVGGDFVRRSRPWNVRVGRADLSIMQRALAETARRGRPVILAVSPEPMSLRRRHWKRLFRLSHHLSRHVEVDALCSAFGPIAASALKRRAEQAVQDLRWMLDLHDNMRSKGRNRPLAAYTDPPPIYALARRLLEAGWSPEQEVDEAFSDVLSQMLPTSDPPDLEELMREIENFRPLDRDVPHYAVPRHRRRLLPDGDVKAVFLEIGRQVIEYVCATAARRPGADRFDPFVGTDPTEVVAGLREGRSSEDWAAVVPTIMQRISLRVLELREQTIILRDHVATLNLWTEAVGRRIWPGGSQQLEALETDAFYLLLDWTRESEAQYSEMSIYAFDRSRRVGGETGPRSDLPPGFLYEPYTVRQSIYGVYYALTTHERMRLLLARMPGDRECRERASTALCELAPLIPDHLRF